MDSDRCGECSSWPLPSLPSSSSSFFIQRRPCAVDRILKSSYYLLVIKGDQADDHPYLHDVMIYLYIYVHECLCGSSSHAASQGFWLKDEKSFPAFIFVACGDQLMRISYSFRSRISPQRLSELRQLWTEKLRRLWFLDKMHVSWFPLFPTLPGQHSACFAVTCAFLRPTEVFCVLFQ